MKNETEHKFKVKAFIDSSKHNGTMDDERGEVKWLNVVNVKKN